jgi:hypothetical protein
MLCGAKRGNKSMTQEKVNKSGTKQPQTTRSGDLIHWLNYNLTDVNLKEI